MTSLERKDDSPSTATSAEENIKPCRLLELPAELRLHIYNILYASTADRIRELPFGNLPYRFMRSEFIHLSALATTNSQLFAEVGPVLLQHEEGIHRALSEKLYDEKRVIQCNGFIVHSYTYMNEEQAIEIVESDTQHARERVRCAVTVVKALQVLWLGFNEGHKGTTRNRKALGHVRKNRRYGKDGANFCKVM